jgi:hypothetical protein
VYGKEAVNEGRAVPLFGQADYYAYDEKTARRYGTVTEYPLPPLTNPFVLDSDTKWKALILDADVPHLDNMGFLHYTESHKVPEATVKLQA